jgi:hypothetical protein
VVADVAVLALPVARLKFDDIGGNFCVDNGPLRPWFARGGQCAAIAVLEHVIADFPSKLPVLGLDGNRLTKTLTL